MNQDKIKKSLDARLSGIQAGPNTAWQVMRQAHQKEKPMKKKLTFALALTLALVLAGVALAASLNVFGLFKNDEAKGKQLEKLAEVASTYAQNTSIPPEAAPAEAPQDDYQKLMAQLKTKTIDFTLEQAYADDKTLSFSYTLKDAARKVSYHDGQPTGDFQWLDEKKGRWFDVHMLNDDDPEVNRQAKEHLNQPGSHYLISQTIGLGDGATLTDGTDLAIQDSQLKILPDGSVQGYMTCHIPDSVPADKPLEVELIIGYTAFLIYQDDAGYKDAYVINPEDQGMKRLTFTIDRNGKTTSLTGSLTHQADSADGSYTAQAQLFLSPVNMKGTVTIKGSQTWIDSWRKANAMMDDATGVVDRIFDYVLYAGDTPYVNKHGGISLKENGDIVIGLDFDAPAPGQPLHLRPVYREGEVTGEDMMIK